MTGRRNSCEVPSYPSFAQVPKERQASNEIDFLVVCASAGRSLPAPRSFVNAGVNRRTAPAYSGAALLLAGARRNNFINFVSDTLGINFVSDTLGRAAHLFRYSSCSLATLGIFHSPVSPVRRRMIDILHCRWRTYSPSPKEHARDRVALAAMHTKRARRLRRR